MARPLTTAQGAQQQTAEGCNGQANPRPPTQHCKHRCRAPSLQPTTPSATKLQLQLMVFTAWTALVQLHGLHGLLQRMPPTRAPGDRGKSRDAVTDRRLDHSRRPGDVPASLQPAPLAGRPLGRPRVVSLAAVRTSWEGAMLQLQLQLLPGCLKMGDVPASRLAVSRPRGWPGECSVAQAAPQGRRAPIRVLVGEVRFAMLGARARCPGCPESMLPGSAAWRPLPASARGTARSALQTPSVLLMFTAWPEACR